MALAGITVEAQAVRNAMEAKTNRKEVMIDEKTIERDKKEHVEFMGKLKGFEEAFKAKDEIRLQNLKNAILKDMQREVNQGLNKMAAARREIGSSRSELESEKREVRRDRRELRRDPDVGMDDERDLARDRVNRRDDRRDLADDRRDAEKRMELHNRQKYILNIIRNYNFRFEGELSEKTVVNKALLTEFARLMEQDIAESIKELNEDRREIREDRRERRDDRKERNERIRNN